MTPRTFIALDETPQVVHAAVGSIGIVIIDNPDTSDPVFVKLYRSASAPAVASVTPAIELKVEAGTAMPWPVFADGAQWWIAAGSVRGADATAPSTAPNVTIMT
jgi:hypothetical protein